MRYGYARVSTKGQARDGNSLEAQIASLQEYGAEVIYKDAYTGTKASRPEFEKLLGELKSGDTLLVSKLDRFARSLTDGVNLVSELIERGVKVHILNIGIMDNTPSSKLIRNIFFSFAEFERDMIIERTMAGKEIAKQNPDYREGRPSKRPEGLAEYHGKVDRGEMTIKAACEELGISVSSWRRYREAV
jgi:DNA invertase Pin-like site-specific DNA recombinase